MPHKIHHRGPAPEDARLFGAEVLPLLRQATSDLCWLLDHGYALASAVALVGDRYELRQRQRLAIARCAVANPALTRFAQHEVGPAQLRDRELWLDGFNVLTAVEAALGGAVLLVGRDSCCRDMGGYHRRYRRVAETVRALELIGELTTAWGVCQCRWWLDQPVWNSGRLKGIILDVAAAHAWPWEVNLVANPDRLLAKTDQIVATADREILSACRHWFNLARRVIVRQVPQAWVVELCV